MVCIGLILNGIAVSFYLLSGFGADSISVFNAGLANTFGITVGLGSLAFYFIVIVVTAFVDRHYISVATILSLIIVGPSIDIFMKLFSHAVTPESPMIIRLLFFTMAFLCLAFAVALYLSANFGISAADMIPVIVADKAHLQFRYCKIAFDITVVVIGFFLGGAFGWGTIFMAICNGPTIQFFRNQIESRLVAPLIQKENSQDLQDAQDVEETEKACK